MTVWNRTIRDINTPLDVRSVTDFAPLFFLQNAGSFLWPWIALVALIVVRTLVGFTTVYLLSRIISDFTSLSREELITWYAPLWLATLTLCEFLDYLNRRFGEALATIYGDVITRRLYASLLKEPYAFISTVSRERLAGLVSRYVAHIQGFLHDCEWDLVMYVTRLFVIVVILGMQSPLVLIANAVYIIVFLSVAFRLSSKFSRLADQDSQRGVEMDALVLNLFLNAPFLNRLALHNFFLAIQQPTILARWRVFSEVRQFHATRWFIQLNLFNLMYFCTMLYGVLQVKDGALALGFILLIKWSFDELWKILVYFIEYYVKIVQQAADAALLRAALLRAALPSGQPTETKEVIYIPSQWNKLEVIGTSSGYLGRSGQEVEVPRFYIRRGEWVGVVGPSGAGKSTALLAILNILGGNGTIQIDGKEVGIGRLAPEDVTLVTTTDPLLKLSLRDNLTFGRNTSEEEIHAALRAAGVDFNISLDDIVGSGTFALSAGEEQRIRLARGLLHPGSVLLLDEPFTALDSDTKARIKKHLKEYLRERAVVLVSHDAEDLELVERTYCMEGYRLVEP
jgi:ABC-type bacteriocin/lantibiotic exporter with double-glycine peptidase domain